MIFTEAPCPKILNFQEQMPRPHKRDCFLLWKEVFLLYQERIESWNGGRPLGFLVFESQKQLIRMISSKNHNFWATFSIFDKLFRHFQTVLFCTSRCKAAQPPVVQYVESKFDFFTEVLSDFGRNFELWLSEQTFPSSLGFLNSWFFVFVLNFSNFFSARFCSSRISLLCTHSLTIDRMRWETSQAFQDVGEEKMREGGRWAVGKRCEKPPSLLR
jgi:hypothetical protein